ncbi:MAG TPA: hypothetical protein VM238_21060 [Phycisphaerae bacterium]|nr:hypothetical protein [Phycisphaerae bacterium]
MSYPRNAASPKPICVGSVVLIADGTVQTSDCFARVSLDGGGWGAGGGSLAYDATSGVVTYAPIQAETNGDVLKIAVYKAACLGCSVNVLMDSTKLLKYVQLLARKDAAIATDNATELTEINANGGSGAGAWSNQTDGQEATRDKLPANLEDLSITDDTGLVKATDANGNALATTNTRLPQ